MSLTDEQRRRIEDNRARAQCRLRERHLAQGPRGSATNGVDTSRPASADGGNGGRGGRQGDGADAGGASAGSRAEGRGQTATKKSFPGDERERDGGSSSQTTATAAAAAAAAEASAVDATRRKPPAASCSTRSGGGRARGSRAGGGHSGGSTEDGCFSSSRTCRSGGASGGGGGGGRVAGPAAAPALACEGCGSTEDDARVDKELLEGFGVTVCRSCKLSREEFQCVTKKEAKETYLLPEGTIAVLKFIERDNPHHSAWTKMKLYLRREVATYSHKRWGGEDGLSAEKERRDALKYDRSLARTKGVFKRRRSDAEDGGFAGGFL